MISPRSREGSDSTGAGGPGAVISAAMATTEWRATLELPGGPLECTIRRSSRARNFRITVDPRQTAIVTIPSRAARGKGDVERLARGFVEEREAWLRRHLDRQARQREQIAAMGPLRDGGLFRFRGELHSVRIVAAGSRRRTTVSREGGEQGDELVIRLRPGERRPLEAILAAWLRERARTAIEREIDKHAAALGVTPAAVTIRDARTRWGSCSRSRRLAFSWRLVLAPPEALETVVVHELAHLRVFGHGPAFWSVVATRRTDHRRWRRWLHDHSLELHSALDGLAGEGR
jgi:predicted metal-dependent hydrolase